MSTKFKLNIVGSGAVNNVKFDAVGAGECCTQTGQISFEVRFSRLARGSHPLANLLGVLILPTVFGREHQDAENLITITGGNFGFTQVMTGEGIEVTSVGEMSRVGDEITWRSDASGQVTLSDVSSIEPFTATMLPCGPGKILDVLSVPLVEAGRLVQVQAIREFRFGSEPGLKCYQTRKITVLPKFDALSVRVMITSDIKIFPGAETLLPATRENC